MLLLPVLLAPKQPGKSAPDPFTPEALEARVKGLVPRIEHHSGRSFTHVPRVRLTDDPDFVASVTEEQEYILDRILPDTPAAYRSSVAQRNAHAIRVGVLGKYAMLDQTVYLQRDALIRATRRDDADALDIDDVLTLVLAHELTHALQDQTHPLKAAVEDIQDLEHLQAASACWEGLAGYTARQIADEQKLDPVFWHLTELQGWGQHGLVNPAAWDTWFTYGQGLAFMTVQAQTGADSLWAPIETPPGQTRDLFHPSDWSREIPTPPQDYAAALRGVEQTLTRGDWEVANTRVGEATLRGEAQWAPEEQQQLADLLNELVWAHGLVLSRPDRDALIRILEFRTEEAADRWMDLQQAQRSGFNRANSQALGVPIDVHSEPAQDISADRALSRVERIPVGGGRHEERHAVWARRGTTIVSVAGERFRPGMRLAWTTEAVFQRLPQRNSTPTP